MNPEPLPDVYRAALDDATFDAYLRDLRALDGPLERPEPLRSSGPQ